VKASATDDAAPSSPREFDAAEPSRPERPAWSLRHVTSLPGANLPGGDVLADRLAGSLSLREKTVATAESCTAGRIAQAIAAAPNASAVLFGGFVVYRTDAKTRLLGVPSDLLERHSAVSPEVARVMAEGVLRHTPADLAIAVTGVTGGCPDESGNPCGRVYIAVARPDAAILWHCEFGDYPARVLQDATVRIALAGAVELAAAA
jgi:nicotinamide-nucleotide amidase